MMETQNLDGFWIHIDVDVLNDDVMPAVDSRQPGGLHNKELEEILNLLLADSKVKGVEITILDPDLDLTGQFTRDFVKNFCNTFKSSWKNYN